MTAEEQKQLDDIGLELVNVKNLLETEKEVNEELRGANATLAEEIDSLKKLELGATDEALVKEIEELKATIEKKDAYIKGQNTKLKKAGKKDPKGLINH